MKNKDFYKETMEQVTMSDEAFRAVQNLETSRAPKKFTLKYVVAAASVAIAIFVSSNVLVYALTGESLVEMIPKLISAEKPIELKPTDVVVGGNVNQSKEDIVSTEAPQVGVPRVVDFYIDANGAHTYVIDLNGRIQKFSVTVDGVLEHSSVIVFSTYGKAGIICMEGTLIEKDDRILLSISEKTIDITEDFADGVAVGRWDEERAWMTGMTFEYTVTGTLEEYMVSVRLVAE